MTNTVVNAQVERDQGLRRPVVVQGRRGPRGVPSDVLHELIRGGLSNAEINAELVSRGLVDSPLTRQALSQFRRRHGYPAQRLALPDRERLIPWVVTEPDARHRYYHCLLLVVRDRAGRELAKKDRLQMEKFLEEIFPPQGPRMVVKYSRKHGWSLVPPRPGVDQNLIRDPRLDDDGRPIDWSPYA